jgi:hypothetical protein
MLVVVALAALVAGLGARSLTQRLFMHFLKTYKL